MRRGNTVGVGDVVVTIEAGEEGDEDYMAVVVKETDGTILHDLRFYDAVEVTWLVELTLAAATQYHRQQILNKKEGTAA